MLPGANYSSKETFMKFLALFLLAFIVSGCSISRHVVPVDSTVSVNNIYVLNNEKVHMDGMNQELVNQFQSLGFESQLYEGDKPAEAIHTFTYTANWAWDMAMYLVYFRGTLYEEGRVIGEVEYDAKMGGANMNKFGKTKDKIQPLLTELMSKVNRNKISAISTHPEAVAGN